MQTEQMETYTQKFGQFQRINSKPFTILDDQWKDTDTVHSIKPTKPSLLLGISPVKQRGRNERTLNGMNEAYRNRVRYSLPLKNSETAGRQENGTNGAAAIWPELGSHRRDGGRYRSGRREKRRRGEVGGKP